MCKSEKICILPIQYSDLSQSDIIRDYGPSLDWRGEFTAS